MNALRRGSFPRIVPAVFQKIRAQQGKRSAIRIVCTQYRAQKNHSVAICPEDAQLIYDALINGDRLMSVYGNGEESCWIINEWDRSITTVLMPEDY
jgi:hypothetical protein